MRHEMYFAIDNRKWKLENVNSRLWEVTMFENDKFMGSWCFDNEADAMYEILSYSEIENWND